MTSMPPGVLKQTNVGDVPLSFKEDDVPRPYGQGVSLRKLIE